MPVELQVVTSQSEPAWVLTVSSLIILVLKNHGNYRMVAAIQIHYGATAWYGILMLVPWWRVLCLAVYLLSVLTTLNMRHINFSASLVTSSVTSVTHQQLLVVYKHIPWCVLALSRYIRSWVTWKARNVTITIGPFDNWSTMKCIGMYFDYFYIPAFS